MIMQCQDMWREISNYIDGTVAPSLLTELEEHLAHCRNCAAVLDSTHNILFLIADEKTFSLPVGYSERLHERLSGEMARNAHDNRTAE